MRAKCYGGSGKCIRESLKKSPGALGSPGGLPVNFWGSIAGPLGDRVFFENSFGSLGISCDDLVLGALGTWGVVSGWPLSPLGGSASGLGSFLRKCRFDSGESFSVPRGPHGGRKDSRTTTFLLITC